MKNYRITNPIENEIKTKLVHNFEELLNSSELVSMDLEGLIQVRYYNQNLDIDEEDPYVQLYRLLGQVNYFTEEHPDVVDPFEYFETKSTLNVLNREIDVVESTKDTDLLNALKLVKSYLSDVLQ